MIANRPSIQVTELEERLASPEGRQLQAQLLKQLAELEGRLRIALRSPIPRAEHELLTAATQAAVAATETLRLWHTA